MPSNSEFLLQARCGAFPPSPNSLEEAQCPRPAPGARARPRELWSLPHPGPRVVPLRRTGTAAERLIGMKNEVLRRGGGGGGGGPRGGGGGGGGGAPGGGGEAAAVGHRWAQAV
eukprot:COSAG04_NODE_659_length_11458_cov_3.404173_1_plen_113_part_10